MLDYKAIERVLFWRFFIALMFAAALGAGVTALIFWTF